MKWTFVLMLGVLVAGCTFVYAQAPATEKPSAINNIKAPDAPKVEDGNVYKVDKDGTKWAWCPVMEEKTKVTDKSFYSDKDGKRYYFCCGMCKPKFDENSAPYLKDLDKKLEKLRTPAKKSVPKTEEAK